MGNESNYLKWVTFQVMGHTCRNRPRLKNGSWTYKNGLDLKKWVTLEKMGYVSKK